jgi:hypothetical protein
MSVDDDLDFSFVRSEGGQREVSLLMIETFLAVTITHRCRGYGEFVKRSSLGAKW